MSPPPVPLPIAALPPPTLLPDPVPDPTPEVAPEAVYIPELPLAELPAAQSMGKINERGPAEVINRDSDPEGYNLEELFKEPQPVVRRKAATEARDRIHAQLRFNKNVRYHLYLSFTNNLEGSPTHRRRTRSCFYKIQSKINSERKSNKNTEESGRGK